MKSRRPQRPLLPRVFMPVLGLAISALLNATDVPVEDHPLRLLPAFPNLVFDDNASAVATMDHGGVRHSVVALQRGQIRILPQDRSQSDAPLLLDLREKLKADTGFEEGLHGLAFHPDFAKNRRFYVCYSQQDPRRTVLSEFTVPAGDTLQADPTSERVIFQLSQPLGNHWGGGLAFDNEGFLFLGIGDGGMRDDPYRLGQNLWSLHGTILRLDVNGRTSHTEYAIPVDNPFVDKQEVLSEIWAYGFRNPWGLSYDSATGTLWSGDVGQDTWEEINLIGKGGNYGWSEREGSARLNTRIHTPEGPGPYVDPIHSYGRAKGISVTGGFVYQGSRLGGLQGSYVYGDWGSGKIWALSWDAAAKNATGIRRLYANGGGGPKFNPTVIGPDATGEPLLFSHSPSIIYTLDNQQLLANADEVIESVEEALPSTESPVESPTEFSLEEESS